MATSYRCRVNSTQPEPRRASFPNRRHVGTPGEAPLGDQARHAAIFALARQTRRYPEFDLEALDRSIELNISTPGMEGDRDRAFAHALYHAAVSRWLTLKHLISLYLQRPIEKLDPRVHAAILAGAAQIVFMDRVPAHAAINHAVEWTKAMSHAGSAGLVNAVLRRLAALVCPEEQPRRTREAWTDQRDEIPLGGDTAAALVLAGDVLPEEPLDRLAVATSHPRAIIDHWLRSMSLRDVRALCLHSLADPPVTLNVMHARTPPSSSQLTPHDQPGAMVFSGTRAELSRVLDAHPDVWVQDSSSAGAVASVAGLSSEPRVVLDLCAGQGTKTRQLAAVFPNAQIIASDKDPGRQRTLAAHFHGSSQVRVLEFGKVIPDWLERAELILLDVPCSNTGVLARRPEARYRFTPKVLEKLASVQRQIVADAIPFLSQRPKGRILYSTCSLEDPENAGIVGWAKTWHGFDISHERRVRPAGLPGASPGGYHDGAYSALLS